MTAPSLVSTEDILDALPDELESEVRLSGGANGLGVSLRSRRTKTGELLVVDVVRTTTGFTAADPSPEDVLSGRMSGNVVVKVKAVAKDVLLWAVRPQDVDPLAYAVASAAEELGLSIHSADRFLVSREDALFNWSGFHD